MLVIRFQRVGKKHRAAFRIVLQDSRRKPQSKVLELFGFYDPHTKEKQVQTERVKFWLERGAQPSATLRNMFVDLGIIGGGKVKVWKPKKDNGGATDQDHKVQTMSGEPAVGVEPAVQDVAA